MPYLGMLKSLLQGMPQSQVAVVGMLQSSFGMLCRKKGLIGLEEEVHKCIMNACYLPDLRDASIGAMLNEFGTTVVFERPLDDDSACRWSLVCRGHIVHVVVMQHVAIEMLDSFVCEFLQKRSIWF